MKVKKENVLPHRKCVLSALYCVTISFSSRPSEASASEHTLQVQTFISFCPKTHCFEIIETLSVPYIRFTDRMQGIYVPDITILKDNVIVGKRLVLWCTYINFI